MRRPARRVASVLAMAALGIGCPGTEGTPRASDPASPPAAPAAPGVAPRTAALPAAAAPLDPDLAGTPGLSWAGLCGLDPYLDAPCAGAPTPHYAVLVAVSEDAVVIERSLRAVGGRGLADGYPFATSFDEMPVADRSRHGVAVVAGLFARRDQADRYRDRLPVAAELVELATERGPYDPDAIRVVTMAERAPAWAAADLVALEATLDLALTRTWVDLAAQRARRVAALAKQTPRCLVETGRTFLVRNAVLARFLGNYAAVVCADGGAAWVEWRATRLDSVVTRAGVALVHQVVQVECDRPTIETRRWGATHTATPPRLAPTGPC